MSEETQTSTQTEPTTPATQPVAKPEQTFTQADLDRIVKERLSRAKVDKEAIRLELLKDLGVENPDDKALDTVKARLAAATKAENDQKTELEKVQERVALAEKKAADAEAARQKVEQERRIEKRDSAIVAALKTARANEADDLFILMSAKKPELVAAVMGEDGKVDEKALKAFVDATKEAYKSRFVGTGPGSPSNSGGRNPENKPDFGDKPLVRW